MIAFGCEKCGDEYEVAPEQSGRSAPCLRCGARLRVPAASENLGSVGGFALAPSPEPAPVVVVPPPPARVTARPSRPPEPEADEDDSGTYGLDDDKQSRRYPKDQDDDDDRPRRRYNPDRPPVEDRPRRRPTGQKRRESSNPSSGGKVLGAIGTALFVLVLVARVARIFTHSGASTPQPVIPPRMAPNSPPLNFPPRNPTFPRPNPGLPPNPNFSPPPRTGFVVPHNPAVGQ